MSARAALGRYDDCGFTAARWALWLADGTGKVPRISQGRAAGRFWPPPS